MSFGAITSKDLKLKGKKMPWKDKVSTFIYLKLMLSKSSSDTSEKLIICLLLALCLGVIFWLRRMLLLSSSFILEINDNRPLSNPSPKLINMIRKKWAVHSGLCVYTLGLVLLLCQNETGKPEEMLNAQFTQNDPDSSALLKQDLVLWGCSVQQVGVTVK